MQRDFPIRPILQLTVALALAALPLCAQRGRGPAGPPGGGPGGMVRGEAPAATGAAPRGAAAAANDKPAPAAKPPASAEEAKTADDAKAPAVAPSTPAAAASEAGAPGSGLGAGMDQLRLLPYADQVKQVTADPNFQKLPPRRQREILNQLKRFNALTPQQQQRQIHALHEIGLLKPEQRAGLQSIFDQFQGMTSARRMAFRQAYMGLSRQPADKREAIMNGPVFQQRFGFNANESQMLHQALALNLPADLVGRSPNPALPH